MTITITMKSHESSPYQLQIPCLRITKFIGRLRWSLLVSILALRHDLKTNLRSLSTWSHPILGPGQTHGWPSGYVNIAMEFLAQLWLSYDFKHETWWLSDIGKMNGMLRELPWIYVYSRWGSWGRNSTKIYRYVHGHDRDMFMSI